MAKRNALSWPALGGQRFLEQPFSEPGRAAGRASGGLSRRGFLGAFGAGMAAAGVLGAPFSAEAQAAAPSIVDVLNFALNLEYLEANFYATVTGSAPPPAASGAPLIPGPWTPIAFADSQTMSTAMALYRDEMAHIALLQSTITTLGGTPVAQPSIDLSAGGKIVFAPASGTTPATNVQSLFLSVARQFEAVGASAYAGAAQYVASQGAVLTAAAQILGAESQHLGALNYLCVVQNVSASSPYDAAVDALDFPPLPFVAATATAAAVPPSYFTLTPTAQTITAAAPGSALGPQRSASQVLGIVYGSSNSSTVLATAGVVKGGFFPNGVNGTIAST